MASTVDSLCVPQAHDQQREVVLAVIIQAAGHGDVIPLEQGCVASSGGNSRVAQGHGQRREVVLTSNFPAAVAMASLWAQLRGTYW